MRLVRSLHGDLGTDPLAKGLRVPRLKVHNTRASEAIRRHELHTRGRETGGTYRQTKPSSVCAPEKKPPALMRSTLYCAVHATRWPLSTARIFQSRCTLSGSSHERTDPLLAGLKRARGDCAEALHPHHARAVDLIHKQTLSGNCDCAGKMGRIRDVFGR